ncbi:hypothetical protein [Caulobacter sp.]|uniref:hypothetical protein n=1 Tax=Caulobacter sp. TaxID=78 RepID=UPI001B0265E9|nr:hypothetical protein [Caulobacter sp.]MBO9543039.1 hypothetical protein [Caulobacter sp.]
MLLFAFMTLLAAQDPVPPPPGNVVAPLVIEGRKVPEVPSRLEITDGLNDLLKKEPDRMICLMMTPTGSRIPRWNCGTLRQWYRFQANTGGRDGGPIEDVPPTELVAAVQDQYMRKAMQIRAEKNAAEAAPKR